MAVVVHDDNDDGDHAGVPRQGSEIVARSSAHRYQNKSNEELLVVLGQRDSELAAAHRKIKLLQQTVRRLNVKNEAILAKKNDTKISDPRNMIAAEQLQLERSGKSEIRLTTKGMCAVAVRRNMTMVACHDVGCLLLDDVSRWTVARAEVRCAAALVASAHKFYAVTNDLRTISVHAFRADATNSAIWQRRKLQALELETFTVDDLGDINDNIVTDADVLDLCMTVKRISDLLPVDNAKLSCIVCGGGMRSWTRSYKAMTLQQKTNCWQPLLQRIGNKQRRPSYSHWQHSSQIPLFIIRWTESDRNIE